MGFGMTVIPLLQPWTFCCCSPLSPVVALRRPPSPMAGARIPSAPTTERHRGPSVSEGWRWHPQLDSGPTDWAPGGAVSPGKS